MTQQRWPAAQQAVTLVRNPFDRMVSMFMYVGQRAELRQHQRARGKGKIKKNTTPERDQQLIEIYQRGFRAWVQDLADRTPTIYDVAGDWYDRTCDQISWIEACERCHVIRLEDIDQGFNWLQHTLDCHEPLPRDNSTTHKHYREYYDDHTRDIVTHLFRRDLERFGYEF